MSTHTLVRTDEIVDRAVVAALSRRPETPVSGAPAGPTMAGDGLLSGLLLLSAPRPKKAR